jgi:hypothetical protein
MPRVMFPDGMAIDPLRAWKPVTASSPPAEHGGSTLPGRSEQGLRIIDTGLLSSTGGTVRVTFTDPGATPVTASATTKSMLIGSVSILSGAGSRPSRKGTAGISTSPALVSPPASRVTSCGSLRKLGVE